MSTSICRKSSVLEIVFSENVTPNIQCNSECYKAKLQSVSLHGRSFKFQIIILCFPIWYNGELEIF